MDSVDSSYGVLTTSLLISLSDSFPAVPGGRGQEFCCGHKGRVLRRMRKEGRKEGREGGRNEGRKGGRKEAVCMIDSISRDGVCEGRCACLRSL